MPAGDPIPPGQYGIEQMITEDVPLPGSVAGRRIVKLDFPAQEFRPDAPLDELFTSLGFARSTSGWRYDRTRVLEWFLAQLRALPYTWAQDPWQPGPAQGQAQPTVRDAGPRPSSSAGGDGGTRRGQQRVR